MALPMFHSVVGRLDARALGAGTGLAAPAVLVATAVAAVVSDGGPFQLTAVAIYVVPATVGTLLTGTLLWGLFDPDPGDRVRSAVVGAGTGLLSHLVFWPLAIAVNAVLFADPALAVPTDVVAAARTALGWYVVLLTFGLSLTGWLTVPIGAVTGLALTEAEARNACPVQAATRTGPPWSRG